MTPEQQQEYLNSMIRDFSAGSRVFDGSGVPTDTATVVTSNDPGSTTGLRVVPGAVHADEAGKSSTYDPTKSEDPDRFDPHECGPGG
jgi:hypothetical protein